MRTPVYKLSPKKKNVIKITFILGNLNSHSKQMSRLYRTPDNLSVWFEQWGAIGTRRRCLFNDSSGGQATRVRWEKRLTMREDEGKSFNWLTVTTDLFLLRQCFFQSTNKWRLCTHCDLRNVSMLPVCAKWIRTRKDVLGMSSIWKGKSAWSNVHWYYNEI